MHSRSIHGKRLQEFSLSDFRLGSDGTFTVIYRDRTNPRLSVKIKIKSVFVVAFIFDCVIVYHRNGKMSRGFLINFDFFSMDLYSVTAFKYFFGSPFRIRSAYSSGAL